MIDFGRWHKHALQRRKIAAPSPGERLAIRFMILLGLISLTIFLWWFLDWDHVGYTPLYICLTFALGFRLLKTLHEWYHYASVSVPEMPESTRFWSVDMITTFCAGEPYEMIETTLKAMVAVEYPHKTYLCDEANDPYLKEFCEKIGVIHVYRGENKVNAKAGNVNFCLEHVADGEIVVILDPDHIPEPDFLDRTLPYFEREEIGYVQCVQAYRNREESFVAKGAAEQTYHFYGPMMMSMNSYGTVQAIGANCTFRRAALDSIGGHAPGLSEDMHTAMQLHAKGWKSVYVPELLTRGLVPSTASAYYKQQLKWSRGTFELLFRVYPKLFTKLTWRQRLHYALIPLFFLHGLIGLLDMIVPILSLILAKVPWHMDLIMFAKVVTPLLLLNMLIRQFAQRWMLEEHERGFHVLGGVLLASVWWVHLVGFFYAIFNVKVPYIPTPKDDKLENAWKLNLPSVVMIFLSLFAIVYGLSIDWNPYSFAMAAFAGVNVVILTLGFLMGQQKMMDSLYRSLNMDGFITGLRSFWWNFRHYFLYRLIRNSSLMLALVLIVALTGYTIYEQQRQVAMREMALAETEQVKWFYNGIWLPDQAETGHVQRARQWEARHQIKLQVMGLKLPWPTTAGGSSQQEYALLSEITQRGHTPLVSWEPAGVRNPGVSFYQELVNGRYDDYLIYFARQLRSVHHPVFLCFAPEPDNPNKDWHLPPNQAPDLYKRAWQYVVQIFVSQGASNVGWVWNPWRAEALSAYYPGDNYVQWIGINGLYSEEDEAGAWMEFRERYYPFQRGFAINKALAQKPVMIMQLGSTQQGDAQSSWIDRALKHISQSCPEVHAVVVSGAFEKQAQSKLDERSEFVVQRHLSISMPYVDQAPYRPDFRPEAPPQESDVFPPSSPFVMGEAGHFELLIDGEPFYLKGVAYNPTHHWRDGFLPLTRRQLVKDFSQIREMGANTIRRYGSSDIYDWNILTLAEEHDLKVLYGLWFDPAVDYYADTVAVKKYEAEVLTLVQENQHFPAILGWVLGNETWSSLKFHYQQPYLTQVRFAYVAMIERLAQKIKVLDSKRPVLAALEHSTDLAGNLYDMNRLAPSIDVVGINTYYGERIESLNQLASEFDPERPYLVTAYGPIKYWDPSFAQHSTSLIPREKSSYLKAQNYHHNWQAHIEAHQGHNVGGIAFCWQDRMEGTATWFGITDFKGRLKPAYYALGNAWKHASQVPPLAEVYISSPSGIFRRGQRYTFSAVTENNTRNDVRYHWYLLREKYLDGSGVVNEIDGGRKIRVLIPNDSFTYRLYLYLSDREGNVVTASEAIPIFE